MLSPDLYDEDAEKDINLHTTSYAWVASWLGSRLKWSWRKDTEAAQKLPDNFEQLIEDAFLHLAYLIARYNIPRQRVFMADETFLYYSPESRCVPNYR